MLQCLALVHLRLVPLLGLGIEEVITLEVLYHLGLINAELLYVPNDKLTDGKGPAV